MPVIKDAKSQPCRCQLKNRIASKAAQCITLILSMILIVTACSDSQQPEDSAAAPVLPESFTFFDLGINSRFSEDVRRELGNKLGPDAIEHRSIMDLEFNYNGFLKKYFPALNELNRKLNFPPRERVDHNTVKLMYRYARKKNVPFDYVELVFSNFTGAPLLFRIHFREDDAGIVKTLETKYGQPQVIRWQEENGQSMYWRKNDDILIVSLVPDQFGNPTYQIVIYFVKHLEQLVALEQKERKENSLERTQSGKTAF